MQLPLTIHIGSSRQLLVLLLAAHGAAIAILWPLMVPISAKVALAFAVAASAMLSHGRLRRRQFSSVELDSRGQLTVYGKVGAGDTPGGESVGLPAVLSPLTTVIPGLVVLVLRVGGCRETLVLPVDAIGPAAHRQLRLWLRWRAVLNAA